MKMLPDPLYKKFLGFYIHGTCAPWATTHMQSWDLQTDVNN